ncbi:hypothetical protein L7F22_047948 [Adiantum nelumboides]|nr:hypothetical protein [Adiantum nelumboides]
MPLRLFSRSSPKTAVSDHADTSSQELPRAPLLPLQEASWNSLTNDGRTDLLNTPRSVVKWLSSSPLPDPPFCESQENIVSIAADTNVSSLPTNSKLKPTKDGRLKTFSAFSSADMESGSTSLRSSSSSNGMQDAFCRKNTTEQRSLHATPCGSTLETEFTTIGAMQVARSLKYGQSTGESISHSSALNSNLLNAASNICTQSDFEIEEDANFWKDHNVQVVIRLRPLSSSELVTQGGSRCVRQESAHAITWTGHPESRFTFDLVACETITQEKISKVAGLPMVDNCLLGYNSCMFAYGQTGSGKTFTMLGDLEGAQHRPSTNRGMTPRVFEYLFARILEEEEKRRSEQLKLMCKCSFLEIYNEQILDLLEPSTANLQLREDARRGVYVENLAEIEVKSVQDVITLLLQGAANRKVASTNMNRESSRSHSVFTCAIESRWISQSIKNSRFGRLHLVDLAGSERQKSSGAEGERLKEAANINKSLSTLGLVIMSLVDIANGKQRHVPYRDSKLTFLLHDSLGGNSKTTIIANISPSKCCALETLSTLKFAQRAKFIRNNAIVNENALGDVMALRLKIQRLEDENSRLRLKVVGACSEDGTVSELVEYGSVGHLGSSLEGWDPFREFPTPRFSSKQRNGLELTLQKTIQRQQTAEAKVKELQAEIEQFKCLVKQREEDTQRGKMMLRFREDKIKRMEAVLGGVISHETYLSNERDSLLEEVQILRARLERNPEVTRFAMENIRLQEELQRYQVFYEEGERDMMEKEIALLQEQLLEALDWKLMHEEDPAIGGKHQDTLIAEKDPYNTQAHSSKLEKQIETVGAVASMQAELIAMQDAVVAAKGSETEANKQAALLLAEVEALKSGLKELQEENAKLASERSLKELQNENAQLQCMREAAETGALVEALKGELKLFQERHADEIDKLKGCLLEPQHEVQKTRRHQCAEIKEFFVKDSQGLEHVSGVEPCLCETVPHPQSWPTSECTEAAIIQTTIPNGQFMDSDVRVLQEKLIHMEESNGRLSALLESSVAENEALLKKINENEADVCSKNEMELTWNESEFSQLKEMIFKVQLENTRLQNELESALLEKDYLTARLTDYLEKSKINKEEMQKLRLSLSSSERELENIKKACTVEPSVYGYQQEEETNQHSKDVEAKLSDLSVVVDSTIVCIKNECDGRHENLIQSLTEVSMLQKETKHIVERHQMAQLRLHQENNKAKAMRIILGGFQASKLDWYSREQRLQDHVQGLSGTLTEKGIEICKLKTEEENYRSCLDELCKQEELLELEVAALREKLHSAEHGLVEVSECSSGPSAKSGYSMLQLLREEEEKATLLSVIAEDQDKLKLIQTEIKQIKGCIDKKETTLLCSHVEQEATACSLQEAEAELKEVQKEVQMLIETEAEVQGELDALTHGHQEMESEEADLMKQLESAQSRMQIVEVFSGRR